MIAFLNLMRVLSRKSPQVAESGGGFGDLSTARIVLCVLLLVPSLLGAAWICDRMGLNGDTRYEAKGTLAVYATAIVFAIVVSGLLMECAAR